MQSVNFSVVTRHATRGTWNADIFEGNPFLSHFQLLYLSLLSPLFLLCPVLK